MIHNLLIPVTPKTGTAYLCRPFLLAFIFFLSFNSGCSHGRSDQAPDFSLSTLENPAEVVTLSSLYEKGPVLVAFWASWCPACVEEIPILNEWSGEFEPEGLKILGVNVQESTEQVAAFLRENPAHYPILMDFDGEVAEKFDLSGLPVTVLLAKGGEILYYGFSLPIDIRELLKKNKHK